MPEGCRRPRWAAVDAFWADFDTKIDANAASGASWQECIPEETVTCTEPAFGWDGWYGPEHLMPSHVDTTKQRPAAPPGPGPEAAMPDWADLGGPFSVGRVQAPVRADRQRAAFPLLGASSVLM